MKSLNDLRMHFGIRPVRYLLANLICWVRGHKVNPGDYTDRHGEHDSLSYCERCRKYDI
jgi:hypothetical protein